MLQIYCLFVAALPGSNQGQQAQFVSCPPHLKVDYVIGETSDVLRNLIYSYCQLGLQGVLSLFMFPLILLYVLPVFTGPYFTSQSYPTRRPILILM